MRAILVSAVHDTENRSHCHRAFKQHDSEHQRVLDFLRIIRINYLKEFTSSIPEILSAGSGDECCREGDGWTPFR